MAARQIPSRARGANRAPASALRALLFGGLAVVTSTVGCGGTDARSSHDRVLSRASETPVAPPASAPPTPTDAPSAVPVAPLAPHEGKNFADEVKLLYRVAACQGDSALPTDLDAETVESYCKELRTTIDKY